jgi:8-amino-7-oxononanoate synthase
LGLKPLLSAANQPQSAIIPGNEKVKAIATQLQENGFDVKPFSTVPEGQERLRFCLHSYNSPEEISAVMHCILSLLKKF